MTYTKIPGITHRTRPAIQASWIRMDRPSSGRMRGRIRAQASDRVALRPSTASPTTTVSRPDRIVWANQPSTALSSSPPMEPENASRTWERSAFSPRDAVAALRSWKSVSVAKKVPIDTMLTTTAEKPSMTPGLARTVEMAPSSSSEIPRGRSGTTPGLGAAGAR